jgi:CheY-like chemotaxis protein
MIGRPDKPYPRLIDILLVDDDEGDILLAKRALENGKIFNTMHVARDGVEAMAYLKQHSPAFRGPT